jgi:electron transfer flavoprotein alpha subunit
MHKILIVGEHDGKTLNPATAKCVTCAAGIEGAEISVAVLGADTAAVAAQAAALAGVKQVVRVDRVENLHPLAAVFAPQVAALAADYTHIFGPSTSFGKDLMPRVAGLLGVAQVSDLMAVESAYRFRRPIYAGNAIVTVEADASRKLIATVRVASFQAAPAGGSAAIESKTLSAALPTHTRYVGAKSGSTDRPDLQTAARVVSGGRALGSAENFKLLFSLADKIGAAVGASRAAVDAGYAPNEMQVGQTGKIISPELYIAVGISGAIQHLTGIKDARTIVAINKDGEAPIFEVADIGLAGDLFQVVPELERLIGGKGRAGSRAAAAEARLRCRALQSCFRAASEHSPLRTP